MTSNLVTLNAAEIRIVTWVARQRFAANRAAGVVDAQVGPQEASETDLYGFGGELAFAKLFNVYPDFDIAPRRGSADCERFAERIDVKTTIYPHGRLLALPRKRELAADVYALMVVDWPTYRFAGFARAEELLQPWHVIDLGYGNTYGVTQDALTPAQLR